MLPGSIREECLVAVRFGERLTVQRLDGPGRAKDRYGDAFYDCMHNVALPPLTMHGRRQHAGPHQHGSLASAVGILRSDDERPAMARERPPTTAQEDAPESSRAIQVLQLIAHPLLDLPIEAFAPRKREHAMTAPHFGVGSACGDTETSAPCA